GRFAITAIGYEIFGPSALGTANTVRAFFERATSVLYTMPACAPADSTAARAARTSVPGSTRSATSFHTSVFSSQALAYLPAGTVSTLPSERRLTAGSASCAGVNG